MFRRRDVFSVTVAIVRDASLAKHLVAGRFLAGPGPRRLDSIHDVDPTPRGGRILVNKTVEVVWAIVGIDSLMVVVYGPPAHPSFATNCLDHPPPQRYFGVIINAPHHRRILDEWVAIEFCSNPRWYSNAHDKVNCGVDRIVVVKSKRRVVGYC